VNKIFNNIKFKDSNDPIEIFCPKKYKNYYIRGQIIELSCNIYDENFNDGYAYAYYHLVLYALISDEYFKNMDDDKSDIYYSQLGIFTGRSKKEFLKVRREKEKEAIRLWPKTYIKTIADILKEMLDQKNEPIEVAFEDIEIKESQYLLNSIKDKKEIILININISLDRIIDHESNTEILKYPKRIYTLLSQGMNDDSKYYYDEDTGAFFTDLNNILSMNLDYDFNSKHEYYSLLGDIARVIQEWEKNNISKEFIKGVNNIISAVNVQEKPFQIFAFSFLKDLIDELLFGKIISQCSFCGNVFPYKKGKLFCSLKAEGKDCGKSARNKRFYLKNKDKILPKAREATKELRKYYREKGIDK